MISNGLYWLYIKYFFVTISELLYGPFGTRIKDQGQENHKNKFITLAMYYHIPKDFYKNRSYIKKKKK